MSTMWSRGLIGVGAVVVLAAGCSSSSGSSPSPSSSSPGASASLSASAAALSVSSVDLSRAIEHVHGLVATDPGTVVAGTHSGARTVNDDGDVSAPGEDRNDLMGMTGEAGTQRLASSGHPGPGSSLPNPVGLITSDDGGETWSPVSLQGQVDFHALTIRGKNAVGFPGGAGLMISDDGGRTWTDGAQIQPAALAFSGDRVLATTESGLLVSTNGGKSFNDVKDAPMLVFVSAGTDETVLGLDPAGSVWSSIDRGETWAKVGSAPDAQAVAALSGGGGYAISQDTLFVIGSASM